MRTDVLTSFIIQLRILYTIHRLLNDGEFHTIKEIGVLIERKDRQTFEYVHLLKRLNAPVLSIPGKGYRYHPFPYVFNITESFIHSAVAKLEMEQARYTRLVLGRDSYIQRKYPSLKRVIIPTQ